MPKNMLVRLGVDASDFKKKMAQAGVLSAATGAKIKNALNAEGFSGVRKMVAEMESARDAIISATQGMDISQPLSKQIEQLRSDRDKILSEQSKVTAKISEMQHAPVRNTGAALEKQHAKIKALKDELAGLRGAYAAVSDELSALEDVASSIDPEFMRFASHTGLKQLENEIDSLKNALQDVSKSENFVSRAAKSLQNMSSSGRKLSIIPGFLRRIGSSADSSNNRLEKMVRNIRNISVVSLGLRLVRGLFGELGTIIRQHVSQDAALQAQVDALRSSFGQALAPAINVVTNALAALMPYVVGVSNAIGSLISNLFGSGWSTVAADANAAAKAIGGAGGAQEKFNRSLQGFDEITRLESQKSGGGGGGGSSSSGVSTQIEGITPAWVTSFTDSIEKAVKDGDWSGVGASVAETFNKAMASQTKPGSTIGATIADWVNAGIKVAAGFLGNLDWGILIDAIWTNVTDLLTGLFPNGNGDNADPKTHGGMSGGMARYNTEIKSPIKDYFKKYIKQTQEEYPEIGEDIGLGIIYGICDAFENPGTWIKEYIFTPLVEDIQDVFGEGSALGKYVSEWLLGSGDVPGEYEIDVTGNITKINDETRNPTIGNVTANLTKAKDNVISSNRVVKGVTAQLAYTDDGIPRNKKIVGEFTVEATTVRDQIRDKNIKNGILEATAIKDLVKNKALPDGILWIQSFVDKAANRTFTNGVLQVTSVTDKTTNPTVDNGTMSVRKISDLVTNRTIDNGEMRVNSWKDNIGESNKKLTLKAMLEKGWSGALEDAMGIRNLYSTLNVEVPEVKVKWNTSYSEPGNTNSASVGVPKYELTYPTTKNEIGAIFTGTSLLGRVGGRDQIAGEAGREALLPLDRHTWWMDDIAERVVNRIGVSPASADRPIQVNLVVDGKVLATTVVRNVNAQARATGKNPLAAYI